MKYGEIEIDLTDYTESEFNQSLCITKSIYAPKDEGIITAEDLIALSIGFLRTMGFIDKDIIEALTDAANELKTEAIMVEKTNEVC